MFIVWFASRLYESKLKLTANGLCITSSRIPRKDITALNYLSVYPLLLLCQSVSLRIYSTQKNPNMNAMVIPKSLL